MTKQVLLLMEMLRLLQWMLDAVKEARSVGVNQVRKNWKDASRNTQALSWMPRGCGFDQLALDHSLTHLPHALLSKCNTHLHIHPQVVIFPKTPEHLKTPTAEEAFNPNGLAQRTISLLKDTFPDLEVGRGAALKQEMLFSWCWARAV